MKTSLNNAKLRIPNLKGLQIKYASDTDVDEDLISFLYDCTPVQLKLLRFKCASYSPTATKAKFYMRLLQKLVNSTIKIVFLNRLEFNELELEQIVRASCNAETLIFDCCDIHCSVALNFGSALKCKIKKLSFQGWGDTRVKYRNTDWISSPACFDYIIEAVLKSGLRDSLQTISIDRNQTLPAKNVQEKLNKNGMPHVTVDEKYLQIKQS